MSESTALKQEFSLHSYDKIHHKLSQAGGLLSQGSKTILYELPALRSQANSTTWSRWSKISQQKTLIFGTLI